MLPNIKCFKLLLQIWVSFQAFKYLYFSMKWENIRKFEKKLKKKSLRVLKKNFLTPIMILKLNLDFGLGYQVLVTHYFSNSYICFLPGWSGAGINCSLHVALPKHLINQFNWFSNVYNKVLRAYCPHIFCALTTKKVVTTVCILTLGLTQ